MCAARNGRGWQCKRREMGAARNGNVAKYERGEMGTVGNVGGKQELWRAARREVQVLGSSHATQATKTSRQHSKAMCKLTTTHHTTTGPRTGKSGPVRISLPKLCQKSAITIFYEKTVLTFQSVYMCLYGVNVAPAVICMSGYVICGPHAERTLFGGTSTFQSLS